MRKLIPFLLLLPFLAPASRAQTPTLVYSTACANSSIIGSGAGGSFSSTPDYRCPLPELTTAGDTLVLMFGYNSGGSNQSFTVSDNKSNTWVLDTTSAQSNNKTVRMYRATNVAAGTSYVNIHFNSGSLNGNWQPIIAEFYNADALDASSCNTGTSTSITAGSLTPTVTGDLIFQAKYSSTYSSQTTSFTAGSQSNITWALLGQLLGDGAAMQYGVYNSIAAINPTFTQGTSDAFISCAVALKANAAGNAPTATLRVLHQEHDAMPKNAPNPWKMGMVVTAPGAVYISSMENDQISANGVTSVPAPDVGWTLSGADFVGTNGHNHTTIWCGKFNSPPGPILLSVNRTGSANDGIFMMYDVVGGTCNLDADSGGQSSEQMTQVSSLTTCSNCVTPTHQGDIIFANEGQAFCTDTSLVAPSGGILDSGWFTGNSIDGATQTDENNGWMHFYNGSSLSAITVTWGETCGSSAEFYWAGRVAAYQSASLVTQPAPPTQLTATVQ